MQEATRLQALETQLALRLEKRPPLLRLHPLRRPVERPPLQALQRLEKPLAFRFEYRPALLRLGKRSPLQALQRPEGWRLATLQRSREATLLQAHEPMLQ